ncbi:MAG: transposase [Spirochaetes bacterium]|nr:transposase [Spirochaetota bacterium]
MVKIETNENIYHITWVTHNSRISERMVIYKVKVGEKVLLTNVDRKHIYEIIEIIIKEDNLKVLEYNVLEDHVHLVLICKPEDKSNIIRKLKGKSTHLYKKLHHIEDKYNLWAQKYNSSMIKTEKELENVLHYVKYNDLKHSH